MKRHLAGKSEPRFGHIKSYEREFLVIEKRSSYLSNVTKRHQTSPLKSPHKSFKLRMFRFNLYYTVHVE